MKFKKVYFYPWWKMPKASGENVYRGGCRKFSLNTNENISAPHLKMEYAPDKKKS